MRDLFTILMIVVVLSLAAPAMAAWDPANPSPNTKWVQLPDETSNGVDVNATEWDALTLADDWQCTSPGPVTDIHIWGSWKDDNSVLDSTFQLGIWSDNPNGTNGFSEPAQQLWSHEFGPGTYHEEMFSSVQDGEWWHDPYDQEWQPASDYTIWQYNFHVPEGEEFVQQGTAANPQVYWLSVSAVMPLALPQERFGWKTTTLDDRWNDDAVFSRLSSPWAELLYQSPHPYGSLAYPENSMDLAFVIEGVPEPSSFVLAATALTGLVILAWRRRRRKA